MLQYHQCKNVFLHQNQMQVINLSQWNIEDEYLKYFLKVHTRVLISWFISHLSVLSNSLTDGHVSYDAQATYVGLSKKAKSLIIKIWKLNDVRLRRYWIVTSYQYITIIKFIALESSKHMRNTHSNALHIYNWTQTFKQLKHYILH